MLLLGVVQFAVHRGSLLVQLAAAFLGGGDGHAVLGQGVDGLLMFGRAPIDQLLLVRRFARRAWRRRSAPLSIGRFQLVELRLQGPQLAPPRNQAGGDVSRSDGQRAVGFQQLAGKGDEASGPRPTERANAWRGRVSRQTTCGPTAAGPAGAKLRLASRRTGRRGRARRGGLRDRVGGARDVCR